MVTSLYTNPNWDQEGNDREERVKELNKHFDHSIELVYKPELANGPDIDWNHPFYAAAKRGLDKTREKYAWALEKQRKMAEIVEPYDEEQMRARERGRQAIDQFRGT